MEEKKLPDGMEGAQTVRKIFFLQDILNNEKYLKRVSIYPSKFCAIYRFFHFCSTILLHTSLQKANNSPTKGYFCADLIQHDEEFSGRTAMAWNVTFQN
jgi:hypothetical protein